VFHLENGLTLCNQKALKLFKINDL
jgi:hypothetical protein